MSEEDWESYMAQEPPSLDAVAFQDSAPTTNLTLSWSPEICREGESAEEISYMGKIRKVCSNCGNMHKACSGPPAPCERCIAKNLADQCVFLERRKPGPRSGKNSSFESTSLSDSEQKSSVKAGANDQIVASAYTKTKIGSLEYAIVQKLISLGFLNGNSPEYVMDAISKAVTVWRIVESNRSSSAAGKRFQLGLNVQEFVQAMLTFQNSNPENTDYDLKEKDLESLFFLSSRGDQLVPVYLLGLVFMWLGPASIPANFVIMPANMAIRYIFRFLHIHPSSTLSRFRGFMSRTQAVRDLQRGLPNAENFIYRLHEGRVVSGGFFIRNMSISRYSDERIKEFASFPKGTRFFSLNPFVNSDFNHELLIPMSKALRNREDDLYDYDRYRSSSE